MLVSGAGLFVAGRNGPVRDEVDQDVDHCEGLGRTGTLVAQTLTLNYFGIGNNRASVTIVALSKAIILTKRWFVSRFHFL